MSYANGTAHYNLPQTVGTDKRDWFDTNQAFADLDAAVYGVDEQSATDHGDIAAMKSTIANLQAADIQFQSDLGDTNGRVSTLEQNATKDEEAIQDLADMFCPLEVATAESDINVATGRMFRYNGVLYMATTDIAIGDTIVPNTNCIATNMEEELSQINTALSDLNDDIINVSHTFTDTSIAASSETQTNLPAAPTGYTFIGATITSTGDSAIIARSIDSEKAVWHNLSASSHQVSPKINILYKKS